MSFTAENLAGRPDLIRRVYELGGVVFNGARRGAEHRVLCPFHADHTPSMDVNLDTGLFICRSCGAGGDPVDFRSRRERLSTEDTIAELRALLSIENIPPPRGASPAQSMASARNGPSPLEFWKSLPTEDAAGIAYLEGRRLWPVAADVRFAPGDYYRIAVPLFDAAGEIVNVQRRPAVARELIQGAAFLPIAGAPLKGSSFGRLAERPGPVWIVEGLTDFLAAAELAGALGVVPLGVPGVKNALALVEARAEQLAGRIVRVSFDRDEPGRAAAAETLKALKAAGAQPILAPYPAGFGDLAEIVEKVGPEGAAGVVREMFAAAAEEAPPVVATESDPPPAAAPAAYVPRCFSLADLASAPPPALTWRVAGLIQREGISGLIGRPKIGKSFLLQLLGLCVSGNVDFLGKKIMPGRVLYIDEEMGRAAIFSRWLRMRAAHPAFNAAETLSRYHFVSLGGLSVEKPNQIRAEIEKAEPDLLIVDSFRRVFRGKENDSDQIANAMAFFASLRTDYGIDLALSHHTRKNLEGSEFWEDAARGSSDFFAACDGLLGIGKRGRGLAEVRATLRAAAEPDPINLALDEETLVWQPTTRMPEGGAPFDALKAIEEIVLSKPGHAWPRKLVAQILQAEYDRTERSAEKTLSGLPEAGPDGRAPLGARIFKRRVPGTQNEREIVLASPEANA